MALKIWKIENIEWKHGFKNMENLIFFSFIFLIGIICIISPNSVAQLLSGFSLFSEKHSKARAPIVRLMGVTIIIIALSMFYGELNV